MGIVFCLVLACGLVGFDISSNDYCESGNCVSGTPLDCTTVTFQAGVQTVQDWVSGRNPN